MAEEYLKGVLGLNILITGANRGLGFEVAKILSQKGHTIILTSRDLKKLKAVQIPNSLKFFLDVSKPETIKELQSALRKKRIAVEALINNAGVSLDLSESPLQTSSRKMLATFKVNTLGPMLLMQTFFPEMLDRGFGRIVNVSSQLGAMNEMKGNSTSYRTSKAGLNALTQIFADLADRSGHDILVNAVCPGWVRSDMGGSRAPRSLEQGAAGIAWAILLPRGGPNGGFFLDRKQISW